MLAGTLGGLLATWVTFTPCFLWIFLGAPFIEVLRGNKALNGALSAITAAVVGVILNLAIWFAIHTMFRATTPVRGFGFVVRRAGARERRSLGARAVGRRDRRDLPLQGRDDVDARGLLGGRHRALPAWVTVSMHARSLDRDRRREPSSWRASPADTIKFIGGTVGAPPADFEFARTGSGPPGVWAIVRDDDRRRRLRHRAASQDRTDYRFPLAIYQPVSCQERRCQVRFKAISGNVDRAGGIAVAAHRPQRLLRRARQRARRQRPLLSRGEGQPGTARDRQR